MKTILILGAGRSSSSLISYLLKYAADHQAQVIVGDVSIDAARQKTTGHSCAKAIYFDIQDTESSNAAIAEADVVISLLPAHLHPLVAIRCLEYGKHLLTASYVSDEMKAFHSEALSKGLLFMNECGLDPGIDHMSAMQVIDRIRKENGELVAFESFTGGLIAPDTDPQNPWRYKFTWNPRNVVMAGQSTAKFLQSGKFKYIPYQQLFERTTAVHVPGHGDFEGYANRDSLKYIETYGLQGIKTMLRGTLRNKGFCAAWNVLVQLGCCDDTYEMDGVNNMTHADFINSFLSESHEALPRKIANQFHLPEHAPEIQNLAWSGFFESTPVGLDKGTPAQILEHILNKKWKLRPEDKDQIVMWHRFVYEQNGKLREIQASLIATGVDSIFTAMAQTVGLPLAICAKLLLEEKIKIRGVIIPTSAELYDPILAELKTLGIELQETHIC
jgi:saccharopine dehydrogenase-like NADP-dependent oxidoreductase